MSLQEIRQSLLTLIADVDIAMDAERQTTLEDRMAEVAAELSKLRGSTIFIAVRVRCLHDSAKSVFREWVISEQDHSMSFYGDTLDVAAQKCRDNHAAQVKRAQMRKAAETALPPIDIKYTGSPSHQVANPYTKPASIENEAC